MADTPKYWALADMRYPAGDVEYAKCMKGEEYREITVKAGDALIGAPEKTIKALLAMGREVITTTRPEPARKEKPTKVVKT